MTDSSKFTHAAGSQPEIKFDLPGDAAAVSVSVVDAKGEIIREYELGTMAKGAQSIRWDGKNGKSQEAQAGDYSFRVNAIDAQNKPLQIQTSSGGLVSGVSFESGKPLLIVDGKKIPMEAVGRIEADLPAAPSAPATAPAKALTEPKQNSSASAGAEKIMQPAKNNLPGGLTPETIKNALSALGASSRMDDASGMQPAGAEEGNSPMPLWNPNL